MRGAIVLTSASNLATAALYNNGSGAEALAVWVINPETPSTTSVPVTVVQGTSTIGSAGGVIHPLVSTGFKYAGALYSVDTATAITPDFMICAINEAANPVYPGLPIAILSPGWAIVTQQETGGGADISCGFIWQAVHPEDIDGRHCDVCDGPLIIAVQQ